MLITITTRHCDIPEDLRTRAVAKLRRQMSKTPVRRTPARETR